MGTGSCAEMLHKRMGSKPYLVYLTEQAFRRDHNKLRRVARKDWPRFEELHNRLSKAGIEPIVYVDKLSMKYKRWVGRWGLQALVKVVLSKSSIAKCANTNTIILTAVPQSQTQIEMEHAHAFVVYRESKRARAYIESDGEITFTKKEALEGEVAELIDRAYYVTGERTYDGILAALRIKREKQKIWALKGGYEV